ncbi:TPA: hypothetical protein RQK30_000578 [Vibrio vulnificus]|nr:hypothetical protein [Vibrio vulnificus]
MNKKLVFIESEIKNLVLGNEYHLFTPQNSQAIYQVFHNHSLCISCSLIEEGIGSYNNRLLLGGSDLSVVKKMIARFLDFMGFFKSIKFNSGFFEINKGREFIFFSSYMNKYISQSKFPNFLFSYIEPSVELYDCNASNNENFVLLVLSPYVYLGLSTEDEYKEVLSETILNIRKEYREKIFIKSHPTQVDSMIEDIVSIYDDVFLVNDIHDFHKLVRCLAIYGDFSSMLFYLKISNPKISFNKVPNSLMVLSDDSHVILHEIIFGK